MVLRGGVVIESRVAPTELAQAYAEVLGLRFPDDQIRAQEVSPHEAAYPHNRPYDPRD